jgi:glycosyltransferase involved in cell wall biosynthesis
VRQRRVAIVHERFTEPGGSELVVEQLHAIWPSAPIHASVIDSAALPDGLKGADLRPSPLQRLYRGGTGYAYLLPLLPVAMAHLDLGEADIVITSHHAFANRIRVRPGAMAISYTHTPARWIWDPPTRALEIGRPLGRSALSAFAATQRRPDIVAAQRLHGVMANSRNVADRIRRWWGRSAEIVVPPVDTRFYHPDAIDREDFLLLAGRLVPYKRPEVAVAAARRLGARLLVVGEGRSRSSLEALAGPGIELLGAVDNPTLRDLYRRCAAVVFPGEEDFGIVPVEAQACGAPVIALGAGGVLDTVVDGQTGVLYRPEGPHDEVEALARAIQAFDSASFDSSVIRHHAESYSVESFRETIADVIERLAPPARRRLPPAAGAPRRAQRAGGGVTPS